MTRDNEPALPIQSYKVVRTAISNVAFYGNVEAIDANGVTWTYPFSFFWFDMERKEGSPQQGDQSPGKEP